MITIYSITYDFCAEENVKRKNDKNIHRVNVSVKNIKFVKLNISDSYGLKRTKNFVLDRLS